MDHLWVSHDGLAAHKVFIEDLALPKEFPEFGKHMSERPSDRAARWKLEHHSLAIMQHAFLKIQACIAYKEAIWETRTVEDGLIHLNAAFQKVSDQHIAARQLAAYQFHAQHNEAFTIMVSYAIANPLARHTIHISPFSPSEQEILNVR